MSETEKSTKEHGDPEAFEKEVRWLLGDVLSDVPLRRLAWYFDCSPTSIKRYRDGERMPAGSALNLLSDCIHWTRLYMKNKDMDELSPSWSDCWRKALQDDTLSHVSALRKALVERDGVAESFLEELKLYSEGLMLELGPDIVSDPSNENVHRVMGAAIKKTTQNLLKGFALTVKATIAEGMEDSRKDLISRMMALANRYENAANKFVVPETSRGERETGDQEG